MPPSLTEIEEKILDYMVEYLRTNTYQPSIREIGERFGIRSTKTVSEHLRALAKKGFLERSSSRSRGAKILGVDLHPQAVSVPCYDRLPKGSEGGTETKAEMHLTIDKRLSGARGSFFVRASARDLAELGVSEGDFVLVEPVAADALREGAMVAVRLGSAASFFRYERRGSGAFLRPLGEGGSGAEIADIGELPLVGRIAAVYARLDGRPPLASTTAH